MSEPWVTEQRNSFLLRALARYLNETPTLIGREDVEALSSACRVPREQAYSQLLAAALGLETDLRPRDRELYEAYFPLMLHPLEAAAYESNAYYRNIRIPVMRRGSWRLCGKAYQPYEAFVCNDLRRLADGRVIPSIGYFHRAFSYPAVAQDGREWMLITPNEINTMEPAVQRARGRVLTFGLGLGYFAYMAAEKPEVISVDVVERDPDVIALFHTQILPQFGQRQKVRVIQGDAFAYAAGPMAQERYDFVFTDLWHDPSDGVDLYLRMKRVEGRRPESEYMYWIEPTLQFYLPATASLKP